MSVLSLGAMDGLKLEGLPPGYEPVLLTYRANSNRVKCVKCSSPAADMRWQACEMREMLGD